MNQINQNYHSIPKPQTARQMLYRYSLLIHPLSDINPKTILPPVFAIPITISNTLASSLLNPNFSARSCQSDGKIVD